MLQHSLISQGLEIAHSVCQSLMPSRMPKAYAKLYAKASSGHQVVNMLASDTLIDPL